MDAVLRQVLEETRKLIERGWCQEAYARDEQGAECRKFSENAVSFCLLGAWKRAQNDLKMGFYLDEELEEVLGIPALPYPYNSAASWNDAPGRDKEEILELFDKALA